MSRLFSARNRANNMRCQCSYATSCAEPPNLLRVFDRSSAHISKLLAVRSQAPAQAPSGGVHRVVRLAEVHSERLERLAGSGLAFATGLLDSAGELVCGDRREGAPSTNSQSLGRSGRACRNCRSCSASHVRTSASVACVPRRTTTVVVCFVGSTNAVASASALTIRCGTASTCSLQERRDLASRERRNSSFVPICGGS